MVILGKDGKEYKSVKECLAADKQYDVQRENEQRAKAEKEKSVSARKKELSMNITKAEEARVAAIQEHDIVVQKANELITEAQRKAKEMLTASKKKVSDAVEAKTNAIIAFNKEFGAYKTVLTGNDALNEQRRLLEGVNRFIDRIFFW